MTRRHGSYLDQALDLFERLVRAIERYLHPKPPRTKLEFVVSSPTPKTKELTMLTLKITNEQQIPVTLTPKTNTGKPAKVDGIPTWLVTSGESTVAVAADGMSAMLVSSDNPGETQFLVEADANLGEGVEAISDVITLIVESATASNLGLTAGEPQDKPVA